MASFLFRSKIHSYNETIEKEVTVMLEKQKTWCHEKMEKGKKWYNDHKFVIGYVAGTAVATIGGTLAIMLKEKIFEPKSGEFQVFILRPEDPGDYAIGKVCKDRFGKEHIMDVTFLRAEDRDTLINNIDAAIAETKAIRENS